MSAKQASSFDEAIAWHMRVPALRDDEWSAFVAWLEASPENRRDYDQVAAADFLVGQAECIELGEDQTEPVEVINSRGFGTRYAPYAIAASLALIIAAWGWLPTASSVRTEQTLPGDMRQLARGEGTVIALNGDSRIVLDDRNPRSATLERGEALFTVRHADKPFELNAGGVRIRDLGTIFNVRLEQNSLHVTVTEGAVLVDPEGISLRLNAGEKVDYDLARNIAVKGQSLPADGWINGEFNFEDSRVKDVAEAIRRRSGIELRVSPYLSQQPFTGNIKLSGNEAADVAHLATLLGADYQREGKTWHLTARGARR